jgi:tetratricopeptide (TPR) repeat protein
VAGYGRLDAASGSRAGVALKGRNAPVMAGAICEKGKPKLRRCAATLPKMDDPFGAGEAGHSFGERKFRWALLVVFFCTGLGGRGQTPLTQAPTAQQLGQLAAGHRWAEIVRLAEAMKDRPADVDFYYGLALGQVGRWDVAAQALEEGSKLAPADPRFPVELAGIAFKQKKYAQAVRRLRTAIRLKPEDPYANNFLATVYFLEGNLEAALKYWNRVGKPAIANVREDPELRTDPALLDSAFAFSPAATLRLPEFLDTDARVSGLGIFPQYQFDLDARDDGKFDMVFRARELNGMGDGAWERLFLFFRGIPFQQVEPEFSNWRGQAINFESLARWDAQKRRVVAQLSGPWEHSAKYRWAFGTDLRNENWAVRSGFAGPAPVLASFNMRTERAGFDLTSYASGRVGWVAGAAVSHRDFRNAEPGTVLTPAMLDTGYELQQAARITDVLWRVPERRFQVTAGGESKAARLWSPHAEAFEKLTGELGWNWLPRPQGDDDTMRQSLRAGRIFGQAPLDELFILGLERDNDLPLRAHIGTRDGRKGSAPLGRDYFLENWELDKNMFGNGLVKLQLGPLLDIGKITDPGTALGSHKWLFDTGAQVKLRVFGSGLVFSYGKDLRSGNNAFYLTVLE